MTIDRIHNPYKYGYYTLKKYPLKTENPVKLTYCKKAVREPGWEKVNKVKIIDFKEPVYFTEFGEKEPIYFGSNLRDRIYEFEQEVKQHMSYDHKLNHSLIRSKSKVFEYALCNRFEYFVTLTLNPDLHDRYNLSAFKKKLGKFINNYKWRKSDNIRYVLIPEFHEDGAVHMHGLMCGILPEELRQFTSEEKLPYKLLEKIWRGDIVYDWNEYKKRFGWITLEPIREYENCAKYITKYITKELQQMPKGTQVILCSKGLKTAELLDKGYNVEYDVNNFDFENEYVKIAWMEG